MNKNNSDITVAIKLADECREILRDDFGAKVLYEIKKDGSPVTAKDIACEKRMRQVITDNFANDVVWGEELGQQTGERQWILDPIDGTKSFASGSPLFFTLIALVENNSVSLGILEAPALLQRWVAHLGQCHRYDENIKVDLATITNTTTDLADATIASTYPAASMSAKKLSQACSFSRLGGDAYNFACVASKTLDIAFDENIQPHDYAALLPILKNANACVTDFAGNEPSLSKNCNLIAAGNEKLLEQALKIIKEHA